MQITNDEEYHKVLERIVKGAEYLDNPLIKPEDREKGMQLYDQLCQSIQDYHTICRAN